MIGLLLLLGCWWKWCGNCWAALSRPDRDASSEEPSVSAEDTAGWGLDEVIPVWPDFDDDSWCGPEFGCRVLNKHMLSNGKRLQRMCLLVEMLDLQLLGAPCSLLQHVSGLLPLGCE